MQGKIKWFNPKKGFGFITTEAGNEVFMHSSAWLPERRHPQKGQRVLFFIKEGDQGPEADEVSPAPETVG